MSIWRKLGFVLFLNVALLFLVAVAMEIYLELKYRFVYDPERAAQITPVYWWTLLTHDNVPVGTTSGPLKLVLEPFVVFANQPNQTTQHFSINSLGFRGGEITVDGKTKKRIVVVGSSTAFGTGLNSDRDTFGAQLESLLDAEVINAATVGYGSGQELVSVVNKVVDLHPDLLLTFDGYNDYWIAAKHQRPQVFAAQGLEQIERELKTLTLIRDKFLFERVLNFHLVLFPRLTKSVEMRLPHYFPRSTENRDKDIALAADIYARNVIKMNKLATTFHYRFLCVLQPDRDKDTNYRSFRDMAKRRFRDEGVNYLDLNDSDGHDMKTAWFTDDVHLDVAGHRAIAQALAQKIFQDGFRSPKPTL